MKLKTLLITSMLCGLVGGLAGCKSVVPTSTHEHNYTEVVTTPATCENDGVKTFTCECGDGYTETISATGHTETSETIVTPATSDEAGIAKEVVTCSVCGKEISSTVVSTDSYTAKSSVETVFKLLTGQDVEAYEGTISDTSVRYLGGNFGTTYTGEQLVGFAHNAITAKMTEFVVDEEPAADDDGDFGAVYVYSNDVTGSIVVMQTYAYASTNESKPGNILQIMAYVINASTL